MKKLLGLAFVAIFMMSMTTKDEVLLRQSDPDECDYLADFELSQGGTAEDAEAVWNDCMDEIINELQDFIDD